MGAQRRFFVLLREKTARKEELCIEEERSQWPQGTPGGRWAWLNRNRGRGRVAPEVGSPEYRDPYVGGSTDYFKHLEIALHHPGRKYSQASNKIQRGKCADKCGLKST